MGAATATEAAINTTLHPTSTSAEDSILQAPSAGLAVHFFFTQARDTSYVIVPTLVVPASFADASRRAAIAFIGFCLCRECARARVCRLPQPVQPARGCKFTSEKLKCAQNHTCAHPPIPSARAAVMENLSLVVL